MSGWEFEYEQMPDNCPPGDASAVELLAYHFCRAVPPTAEDFIPLMRRGPTRPFNSPEQECQACGVSLFVDRDDAIALAGTSPLFRKRILTVLVITPDDGVVKHTPSVDRASHHTFWPRAGSAFRNSVRRDEESAA